MKKAFPVLASIAAAFALMLAMAVPAFAANVNGNTAFVNTGNIENQTIVGEGSNNNVVITNTANDAPDPTGIFMANAPLFIIGAFVVTGVVVIVVRAKKNSQED